MGKTKIPWSDWCWNISRGCSRVRTGCLNCWAERYAGRFNGPGLPYEGLVRHTKDGFRWTGEVRLVEKKLEAPLHVRTPQRMLVNSMSDLFHEKVPDRFIADAFGVMGMANWHTFQILTKRYLRMEEFFASSSGQQLADYAASNGWVWPLPNVWVGISVSNQEDADDGIVSLMNVPATIRYISLEPLIDEVDFTMVKCPSHTGIPDPGNCSICRDPTEPPRCNDGYFNTLVDGIDWIIAGCETGARSKIRPMDEDWVRIIRDQCKTYDVAFFFKQCKDEKGKTIETPLLDGCRYVEYPA